MLWIGIKALFGLIVGLFRKDNGDTAGQAPVSTESSAVSSPEGPSESAPAMRSYDDLLSDIAAIDNSSDAEQSAQDRADKYKAGLDPNNQEVELEPLGNYIIDIMIIVATMYSPDGKASFKIEMLEGIDLPTWAGDLT